MGVHMDIAAVKESLRESFQLAWIWIALACVLSAGGFGVWVGYQRASVRDASAITVLSQQVTDLKHANATLTRVCGPGRR
jgi:TRAP-type C4-dicarboxylate transport system permease small subunit